MFSSIIQISLQTLIKKIDALNCLFHICLLKKQSFIVQSAILKVLSGFDMKS